MARERTTKTADARPRDASSVPEPRDSATGRPRTGAEQEIAVADGSVEPHEVNDNLSSDRMKALLEDHRKMGARP